jgi:RNA polymerase sigma-70 factor (ECF subfamily)
MSSRLFAQSLGAQGPPDATPPEPALTAPSAAPDLRAHLDRFRPYLTLLARVHVGRLLQGKVDPDDVVQETYLVAVAAADRFRGTGEAELTAWLREILFSRVYRLVERYCGTAARDVRREGDAGAPGGSSPNGLDFLPADLSTPSRAAQRRERAVAVAEALAALPPEYRDVLVYRNMEGLSFPAIAERMGRSVGAVTMLWARAVRQFRTAYPADA